MSHLREIREEIRKALFSERVRSYRGLENIHLLEAEEPTKRERRVTPDNETTKRYINQDNDETSIINKDAIVDKSRRPIETGDKQLDIASDKQGKYLVNGQATDEGLAALKMHTIWNNNLTQLMNFSKGKELSVKISQRLQEKSGLPSKQMLPIIMAVMKATLEQLDEEVSDEVEESMSGVLDITRS